MNVPTCAHESTHTSVHMCVHEHVDTYIHLKKNLFLPSGGFCEGSTSSACSVRTDGVQGTSLETDT